MNELHWVSPCAHWRLTGSQRPSLGGNGERVGLGTAGESSQSPPWPGDSGSAHSASSFGCLGGGGRIVSWQLYQPHLLCNKKNSPNDMAV